MKPWSSKTKVLSTFSVWLNFWLMTASYSPRWWITILPIRDNFWAETNWYWIFCSPERSWVTCQESTQYFRMSKLLITPVLTHHTCMRWTIVTKQGMVVQVSIGGGLSNEVPGLYDRIGITIVRTKPYNKHMYLRAERHNKSGCPGQWHNG